MPTLNIGELVTAAGPVLGQVLSLAWSITKLILLIAGLFFIYLYTSFNVRLLERKYTKGGKVIATIKKCKTVFDKKLGHPQIQTFGILGFKGKKFNEPPNDCIIPFRSLFGNTVMYDFIVKEGIYYPVSNTILGKKYIVEKGNELGSDDNFISWAAENGLEVKKIIKQGEEEVAIVYSIEGSGLEVTRDFEAEQSSLNNLINAADQYKNRKPIEIAAMYGLMIIIVVGAFVVLIYSFYKSGQVIEAVNRGWELFPEMSKLVAQQKLGPG